MPLRSSHRPFQLLAATTLAVGGLPLVFHLSLPAPAMLAGAYFAWTVAVYLAAAGGPLLAGTTFAPGEPMRPGWLLLAASYAVLLPGRLLTGITARGLVEAPVRSAAALSATSIASGALAVAAFMLLARAWRASGLDLTSRPTRVVLRMVALGVALALAGPDLVDRFPAAARGDAMAIADVITDLLDGALFVVAVPVFRAALALGGGLVVWPWGLLTLSLLAWLGYDASVIWGEAVGLTPRTARVLQEVMRGVGAVSAATAGLAQRWVMQAPPGSAADPEPPSP